MAYNKQSKYSSQKLKEISELDENVNFFFALIQIFLLDKLHIIIQMAQDDSENNEHKRSYSKIPIKVKSKLTKKRMLLVKQVVKRGKPLNQVIKQLNIKVTTARFIINKYKESGAFPRRKFRKNSKRTKRTFKSEKKVENIRSFFQAQERDQNEIVGQNQPKNQPQIKMEQNPCHPFYMCWYFYPYRFD